MRWISFAAKAALAFMLLAGAARAVEPIKIGMSMALSGPLAGTGKAALLGTRMAIDDLNQKGGLLGRPVQLIYYDDQSSPSLVPGIYTKLVDVDQVDLLLSGYATNLIGPAMPIAIQHGFAFIILYGLNVNEEFHYDRFFSIVPQGTDPTREYSRGFFQVAMSMNPKPATVAILGADAEFSRFATDGARENAKKHGLKIVYDKSYPPTTVDFAPIVRAVQATNPDIVYLASYPPDSVGMVRAVNEVGLKAKMFGGGLIGLQYAAVKSQLGPLLNGITTFDTYVPEPTMNFPGVKDFLARYQALAPGEGADQLGFYTPPFAYARVQVLAQAVEAVKNLDQKAIADYLHSAKFETIVGEIKFAPSGEQEQSRVLVIQYHGVAGNDVNQFKEPGKQVILFPPALKSGKFEYPYSSIKR